MNIGIDARFFGAKDRGIGRYVENLIKNLENIDNINQYFIFLSKERFNDYSPGQSNFKKLLFNQIKKIKPDLMHFTYFKVPIFYRGRFIVTIHDLIVSHVNFLKKIAYKIILCLALKGAGKIIAVSEYTKKDIFKHYRVNPEKIKVIYEGVSPARSAKPARLPSLARRPGRSFGGRGKPYILYVGNDYPHKNLKRLKLAFQKLIEDGLDYQLILVTEFVSDKELDNLYKNARLFIFPSLCEGFGLPPLEAMAREVPVVSSNATCLPEVLGDAALYFNPLDINDMADKIKKALTDEDLRKKLIQKGFEQTKKYNWQTMARETLKIYSTLY